VSSFVERYRTVVSWFVERYRQLGPTQRGWLWVIAAVFGARIAYAIEVTGLTRTSSGFDLRAPWSPVFAAIAFVIAVLVVTRPERPPAAASYPRPYRIFVYAALPFAVFCFYLLAFYPALMTEDSYREWDQIVTGKFNAIMPLAYTLFSWVAAGLWKSPAAPVLAQATALALAFGASMVALERAGAPRRLLWGLTAGFALMPLNGAMAVSMWKDIAFAAAVLWLTVIVFRIWESQGDAVRGSRTVLALVAALALVALLRPNGPAPALVTAAVLLACYPKQWRSLGVASGGALFVVLFVNVGLSRVSHQSFDGAGVYNASPFIYDIGAVLRADLEERHVPKKHRKKAKEAGDADEDIQLVWRNERVTPYERATLGQFDNVLEWALMYESRLYPYWHTMRDHWRLLDDPEKRSELMHVWFALALRNPGVILHHRIQTARVGWLIHADDYHTSIYGRRVLPERLGRVIEPPFDWVTWIARFVLWETIDNYRWQPVLANPALPTYLAFFFFALVAVRRRSSRFLAVATPLAANWAATMAFCMAQDVRYFYSAFVVLPFALGLPWTAARAEPGPRPESG
jgi:hypothetical protein